MTSSLWQRFFLMALEDPLQLTWGRWLTPIDSFQHINLPFQVKVLVIFFPTFIFFCYMLLLQALIHLENLYSNSNHKPHLKVARATLSEPDLQCLLHYLFIAALCSAHSHNKGLWHTDPVFFHHSANIWGCKACVCLHNVLIMVDSDSSQCVRTYGEGREGEGSALWSDSQTT